MTKDEAHTIVQKEELGEVSSYAIMPECTEDHGDLWAVYVQSKRYIRTGDDMDMSFGSGATLAEKSTGKIFHTGSALGTQDYINAFRATGDPQAEKIFELEISQFPDNVDREKLISVIKAITQLNKSEIETTADDIIKKKLSCISGRFGGNTNVLFQILGDVKITGKYVWETFDDEDILAELENEESNVSEIVIGDDDDYLLDLFVEIDGPDK